MEMKFKAWLPLIASFLIFQHVTFAAPSTIFGVCYRMMANNLPPPAQVVDLMTNCGIAKFRLYDAHPEVTGLHPKQLVTIGTRNEDLRSLAGSPDFARDWVGANYVPYADKVVYIVVGNEAIPGDNAQYVVAAIRNIRAALDQTGRPDAMVTTAIASTALTNTYPPSQSTFTPDSSAVVADLIQYIKSLPQGHQPSLYVHLYPYLAYTTDPGHFSLDFALFLAQRPGFQDANLTYWNLFDTMYDSFVWAMEKLDGGDVLLTVGETGWPSAGNGSFTTPQLASTYITNLYNHCANGTGSPKRPDGYNDVYVFSLFNQNYMPVGVEQNWGLFYPTMQPVYPTPLCQRSKM